MAIEQIHGLGAAVAPAAFVSACALAALGLDNQASRLALRLRESARELAALGACDPSRATEALRVSVLGRRHVLSARALLLAYGAMAAFVLATVLGLAGANLDLPPFLFASAFTVGAVLLAGMSGCAAGSAHLRLAHGGPVSDWRELARGAEEAGAPDAGRLCVCGGTRTASPDSSAAA